MAVDKNMNIGDKFNELKNKKEGALVAYICAGDPSSENTKQYVNALIKGGADIIELGLPFSDPVADGPSIKSGMERALKSGMTPDIYFKTISDLNVEIPLVAMTYYNILFKRGLSKFVQDCRSSGISGIIIPDLPAEESEELFTLCNRYDIDLIFMIAPTTTETRMEYILSHGRGFIYIISRLGVTGVSSENIPDSLYALINKVKSPIPKLVGFGISNGKQARDLIRAGADGIIVGSAFVNIIAMSDRDNIELRLESLAKELKDGIRDAKNCA